MKATIYFSEVNKMLDKKGQKATLSSSYSSNSFCVNYPLKILFVKKDISAHISLKSFTSSTLTLRFSLQGLGSLEAKGKQILKRKLPGFVSMVGDSELKVDLTQISALKKANMKISLNHFDIDSYGFNIDANIG